LGFFPIGFFKKASGSLGDVFNQLLAVLLSLLFAGMHQLKDEGLQKKTGVKPERELLFMMFCEVNFL